MRRLRGLPWLLLLAWAGGCLHSAHDSVMRGLETEYQGLAAANMHLDRGGDWAKPRIGADLATAATREPNPIQLVSDVQSADNQPPKKDGKFVLTIPPELPGSDDPGFKLPKDKPERDKYFAQIYPALPPLPDDLLLAPGPEGRPLTLADLQRLATQYSPSIRAAEAAVAAARGALRQSLAYPNPTFAFEEDTIQTGPAGYPGFFIDQVIKTGNKLELQGAAASMDLFNAYLALRRARSDVAYQVRNGYFAVLVAQENVYLSRAFARLTDQIYAAQVSLLKGNESAAYEPMQLRPLALQARFNLVQAINQYYASWRQLAANLGLRDMPPSELVGRVDLPVPVFDFDLVSDYVMNRHTDVLTAENNIHKADFQLRLARIQVVPDVEVRALLQKDYTTPPNYAALSVQAGVVLPIWDRNRGNIEQAEGLLLQARHNLSAARNTLQISLADAFNRYLTNKKQAEITLQQTKDQVRAYKAIYNRFRGGDPGVSFGDVVTAQQTLAGYLTAYISALGLQWTAVIDVANLLQTDDLLKGTHGKDAPDVPRQDELQALFQGLPAALNTHEASRPTLPPATAKSVPPSTPTPTLPPVVSTLLEPAHGYSSPSPSPSPHLDPPRLGPPVGQGGPAR
jgi:cobalt-zinc-cadmium efflux system outer membrane protein